MKVTNWIQSIVYTSFLLAGTAQATTLVWDSVTHATHYQVEVKLNGQWQKVNSSPTAQTELLITGLENGDYEFRVGACVEEPGVTIHCGENVGEYSQPELFAINTTDSSIPEEILAAEAPSFANDPGDSSDLVASLPGQFRVDESGAATYTVPLELPSGISGVTPELALSYSSSSGRGLMGMGWNISGLSSISRCRATRVHDGDMESLKLDNTAKYCLDGQRLVSTGDNVYRTEIDNGSIIYARNVGANGPAYFEVKGKDGSTTEYGSSGDSTVTLDSGVEVSWLISKISDNMSASDSDISFNYETGSGANEVLIDSITYSGHTVDFNYHEGARPDKSFSYIGNSKMESHAYLSYIDVTHATVNNVSGSTRKYKFDYVPNTVTVTIPANEEWDPKNGEFIFTPATTVQRTVTNELWLESIEQCVGNSCLPATKFDWTTVTGGFSSSYFSTPEDVGSDVQTVMPIDVNADSIPDVIRVRDTGDQLRVDLAINYDGKLGSFNQLFFITTDKMSDTEFKVADIDSDGHVELLFLSPTDHTNSDYHWRYFDFYKEAKQVSIELPIDEEFEGDNSYKPIRRTTYTTYGNEKPLLAGGQNLLRSGAGRYIQLYDIDGDADTDIVYRADDKSYVVVNSGNENGDLDLLAPVEVDISLPVAAQAETTPGFQSLANRSLTQSATDTGAVFIGTAFADMAEEMAESTPTPTGGNIAGRGLGSTSSALPPNQCNNDGPEEIELKESKIVLPSNLPAYDFNGDGVADLLAKIIDIYRAPALTGNCYTEWKEYYWVPYTLDKDATTGERVYNEYTMLEQSRFRGGHTNSIFMGDFNGDGLTDLLYYGGEEKGVKSPSVNDQKWRLTYNTGTGFTTPKVLNITKSDNSALAPVDMKQATLNDANGDSYVDIVFFNQDRKQWQVIYNGNEGFDTDITLLKTLAASYDKNTDSVFIADMEGDGFVDFAVLEYDNQQLKVYTDGKRNNNPISKIVGITNGLELTTTIDYRRLNDKNTGLYQKDPDSTSNSDSTTPVFDLIMPQYVVSKVTSDAPSTEDASGKLSVSYLYEGLKAEAGGRGMLGFKKLITKDERTDIYTETEYAQEFPFIGMPVKTEQYFMAGESKVMLKSSVNDNQHKVYADGKIYMPYVETSTEKSYVVDSSNESSSTLVSEVVTVNNYTVLSNYANLSTVEVKTKNGNGNVVNTVTTVNSYEAENETKWWIGRLTKSSVTHKRQRNFHDESSRSSVKRESGFAYDDDNGLLKQETVNLGTDTLYTAHCYDSFGNKTSSITSSSDVSCSSSNEDTSNSLTSVFRKAKTTFDSKGLYPTSSGNAQFNSGSITGRNGWGQVTTSTDVNGTQSRAAYDEFGTAYFSSNQTGQWQKQTRTLSDSSDSSRPAISQSYYFSEKVQQAGKPIQYSYYDVMGRKVAVAVQHFDGRYRVQESKYDALGRVTGESLPYFSGGTPAFSTNVYDKFNRLISSTAVDGTLTGFTYSGLTTTSTVTAKNENGGALTAQEKSMTKDATGKDISVTDEAGTITYYYDHTGNLSKVTGVDGFSILTEYDDWGRKIKMTDPDKGIWNYTYNVLGELISQTSANLDTTSFYRDNVGRTIKRTLGSETTRHNYKTEEGKKHLLNETTITSGPTKSFIYDSYGRVTTLRTSLPDGSFYDQTTEYDKHGRVFQTFDATGDFYGIHNQYNIYGYLTKQTEARNAGSSNPTVYREITAMDVWGNVTQYTQGNGIETTRVHNSETGHLNSITAGSNASIVNNEYRFDTLGNLRSRKRNHLNNSSKGYEETFGYDDVNRLTTINNQTVVTYHANGNIDTKAGVGTYCYEDSRPHAVVAIDNCNSNKYVYDKNGNMTSGRGRTITYSAFDKPTVITAANGTTNFDYDASRSRYKRVTTEDGVTTTTYYMGNVEFVSKSDGTSFTRRNLPDAIETRYSNGNSTINYLHKDHLGSIDSITNESGELVQALYFDAWGKKEILAKADLANASTTFTPLTLANLLDITPRGYTGHEHVDHADIIHMNGRIYDPTLGRFLQADPHIQAPSNSQSYNRYSYVLNNPLSYTDPSGYFFKSLFKFVKKYWRTIAAIAASYVTFGLATGAWSFAAIGNLSAGALIGGGAAAGFVSGAIATGSLKGALQGAFSGALFGAIGGLGLNPGQAFAVSGLAGGVMADLQGGKFGHGFITAGVGTVTGGAFGKAPLNRIIGSAIVGGTLSKITGGKFANGALTAAFSVALTSNWSSDDMSGSGSPNFETEGTAEERMKRFNDTKKALSADNVHFDDRYAIVTHDSDGNTLSTEYFTDAGKAREFVNSAAEGTTRGWLSGRHVRQINTFLGMEVSSTSNITLYRTGVMGWTGTGNYGGTIISRYWNPMQRAALTMGHELGHRNGLDLNTGNHINANGYGLELCRKIGRC